MIYLLEYKLCCFLHWENPISKNIRWIKIVILSDVVDLYSGSRSLFYWSQDVCIPSHFTSLNLDVTVHLWPSFMCLSMLRFGHDYWYCYHFNSHIYSLLGFPGGSVAKKPACQCRRRGFDPWSRKMPWRRKWQPTPVFLPGKSHGQRSLVGYSPWGHKESDTTVIKQH